MLYSFVSATGQEVYPSLQRVVRPEPAPAAPGSAFTPPMGGPAPTSTAPASAEWTRTAGPDESLVVTGINFSRYSGVEQGRDTRFVVYGGNMLSQAKIQRLDGDKALITLDGSMSRSMYLIWPGNETGYGYPMTVNKTDAWWVGPDRAAKGTTISIYGRNLSSDNATGASYVYIKPAGAAGQWATVTAVNPYKVDFQIPTTLGNGQYEVWTHNGQGGDYGWSGPLMLNVVNAPQWSSTVFNVKNYGAAGNGSSDDTGPIRSALLAAYQSPGSTIYFPAGVYMISNTLSLGSNTRWQGDGRDRSVIRCASGFSTSATGMLLGNVSNIEITDLSFDGNFNFRGSLDKPVFLRGSSNVRISNVRFSFQNYEIMDLHAGQHIFFTGCEFIGAGSFLGTCSQLFIDRCDFRLTNDAELTLFSWGGWGISLTNSTCRDYNNSDPNSGAGWGKGRFFVGSGIWGSNRLTYLGNNITTDLTVRPTGADQNSGEQILWEGNSTAWAGSVSSSTATTTTLNGFSGAGSNTQYAVVVKGRGLGQARRIVAYSGSTITVEEPWNLPPDGSSVINIGPYTDRVAIYKNYLDGKPRAVTNTTHIASAGIQPYGGVFNLVADNNTIHEVRRGIANWATQHSGFEPTYFNLYVNNQVIGCRWGVENVPSVTNSNGAEVLLGTVYRANTVQGSLLAAVTNTVPTTSNTVLSAFVYEHNTFKDMPTGFEAGAAGIQNQLFYANSFDHGAASVQGAAIQLTPKIALRQNTYQGFTTTYQGSASGVTLEAPYHVLELEGRAGGAGVDTSLVLWNSGPVPFSWTASSGAAWLSLSSSSGSLPDERSSGLIRLTANPGSLPVGTHTAAVTVMASGQVKTYTVRLRVTETTNTPPVVGISSPANNAVFTAPAAITISASVSDADGIARVEFFAGSARLGEDLTAPYSYQWDNVAAGSYTLTARATDQAGLATTSQPVNITVEQTVTNMCPETGSIVWEYWGNIPPEQFRIADIPLNNPPTGTQQLSSFAAPVNFADYYGARVRGYICPPVSGRYVFFIAADDIAELWLSNNGNPSRKKLMASVPEATSPGQYDKFASQRSVAITLKAGRLYYIEALHRELTSGDHLSVGWQLPDGTLQQPISGTHLIPFNVVSNAITTSTQKLPAAETNTRVEEGAFLNVYPNPFYVNTTILFSIPESSSGSVQLYNLQGSLLKTLFSGKMEAGKTYKQMLHRGSYSSGIYIFRLTYGKKVLEKRIVLTRN